MTRRRPNRRGYALILVAVFCVLFVTFMSVAWRRLASTICTFSARSTQFQHDQGMIMALADAMRALEVGPPPPPLSDAEGSQYTCYCCENVPVMQNLKIKSPIALEPRYYTLTFTKAESDSNSRKYMVAVQPRDGPPTNGAVVPLLDMNDFGNRGPL
jgi:hypothetical protein